MFLLTTETLVALLFLTELVLLKCFKRLSLTINLYYLLFHSASKSKKAELCEILKEQLDQSLQDQVMLKDTIGLQSCLIKKLEYQLKLVEKKKDALKESLRLLKRDLWSEKQARFVTENTLQEKLKKLEMDLEFKETEIEELQKKNTDAIDSDSDDDWLYEPHKSIEDESEKSSPPSSINEIEAISSETFFKQAKKHVFHHFVCNVSPASIIVDLDDLMLKYGASSDDCVTVAFECLLDFFNLKNSQLIIAQSIEKYSQVLLNFIEPSFDKLKLLDILTDWTLENESRTQEFLVILMNLYKQEVVEIEDVLEWAEQEANDEATRSIRLKCEPLLDWMRRANSPINQELKKPVKQTKRVSFEQ